MTKGVVWARNDVGTGVCPKSYITADSIRWLELFGAWRLARGGSLLSMPARQVDAFRLIESELSKEMRNDQRGD